MAVLKGMFFCCCFFCGLQYIGSSQIVADCCDGEHLLHSLREAITFYDCKKKKKNTKKKIKIR